MTFDERFKPVSESDAVFAQGTFFCFFGEKYSTLDAICLSQTLYSDTDTTGSFSCLMPLLLRRYPE